MCMDMSCYTHHAAEEHRSASRCSDLLTVDAHGGLSADVRENGLMLAMDVSQGVADQVDVRSSQGFHLAALVLLLALASLLLLAPAAAYATHGVGSLPCDKCHRPHMATIGDGLLYVGDPDLIEGAGVTTQTEICMFCHAVGKDGATKEIDDIGLASGHSVESTTTDPDLTNECSGCHDPHAETAKLPQMTINGWTINTAVDPNSWCRACHDPDSDATDAAGLTPDANWSGVTEDDYYDQIFTSREDDTYIGSGTFRGWTAYENTSAHASIEASPTAGRAKGDCLWCHERHSSTSTYDNLIAEFGPTSKAACDECHDDHLALDPAGDWGTGHFVEQGPAVPIGDLDGKIPLPCYECHNAHGSRNGNAVLGQDSLGANLDPSTPAGQSAFCYTCHLSSDGLGWNSWANDGAGAMQTYAQLVTAAGTSDITTAVAGLPRTEMVQLPSRIKAHDSSEMDKLGCKCHGSVHAPNPKGVPAGGQSCYNCHPYEASMEYDGDDRQLSYHHVLGTSTTPGDTAFESGGYPGAGTTPLVDTEVYCLSCHVDHAKFYDADGNFDDRGANLRESIDSEIAANSDFNTTSGGICLGCHSVERKKNTDNQKSADGTDYTPAIDSSLYGGSAHGVKDDGTTLYEVESAPFGSSTNPSTTFLANCSKCHNDNRTRDFYDGTSAAPTFGLHWSPSRRILAALGRADYASDPYDEEAFCYSCHSPGGSPYKVAANSGKDWYGTWDVTMSSSAEGVYTQFTANNAARRSHRVSASWVGTHSPSWRDETGETGAFSSATRFRAGEHVECADCHSPHAAGKVAVSGRPGNTASVNPPSNAIDPGTSPLSGVWGVGIASTAGWSEPTYVFKESADAEYQICLKCHSGFNSSYTPDTAINRSSGTFSWSAAQDSGPRWTNVALEFNPANDSYHPVFAKPKRAITQQMLAPWNANKGNQTMYCSDCHMDSAASPVAMGPHGSAISRVLRGSWDPYSNPPTITLGNMPADFLCAKCHVLPGTNVTHARSNHQNYSCGSCHIAIPHGGAAPRLLATTGGSDGADSILGPGTPDPYNAGTKLVSFALPTSGTGQKNANCQAADSPCGAHNTNTTDRSYWAW